MYSGWMVIIFILLLVGMVVTVPLAFYTGDWRYLFISAVCFFFLYIGGA